jgi:hypothetical protein
MKRSSVVHSDPDILGGTPVFVGTRVPVQALIDYIEGGHSLEEFHCEPGDRFGRTGAGKGAPSRRCACFLTSAFPGAYARSFPATRSTPLLTSAELASRTARCFNSQQRNSMFS